MADAAAPEATEGEAAARTDERREALVASLSEAFGEALLGSHVQVGMSTVVRVANQSWPEVGRFVRDKLGFTYFDFLSAIDWLPSPYGRYEDSELDAPFPPPMPDPSQAEPGLAGGDTRMQVFACVGKPATDLRLVLKADVADESPTVGTWVHVYAGAAWHERETHEMFGIAFEGNDDLRHIYLPGDFEGHPLRKEYPLLSRVVKPWPGIVDVEPMPGGDDDEAEGGEAT